MINYRIINTAKNFNIAMKNIYIFYTIIIYDSVFSFFRATRYSGFVSQLDCIPDISGIRSQMEPRRSPSFLQTNIIA